MLCNLITLCYFAEESEVSWGENGTKAIPTFWNPVLLLLRGDYGGSDKRRPPSHDSVGSYLHLFIARFNRFRPPKVSYVQSRSDILGFRIVSVHMRWNNKSLR